jgi:hypothetical protein
MRTKCGNIVADVYTMNVVVEWLAKLLRLWNIPDSNLGLKAGCNKLHYVVSLSLYTHLLGCFRKSGHNNFLIHPQQFTKHQ